MFLRRSDDLCFGVFLGSEGAQKLEELAAPYTLRPRPAISRNRPRPAAA